MKTESNVYILLLLITTYMSPAYKCYAFVLDVFDLPLYCPGIFFARRIRDYVAYVSSFMLIRRCLQLFTTTTLLTSCKNTQINIYLPLVKDIDIHTTQGTSPYYSSTSVPAGGLNSKPMEPIFLAVSGHRSNYPTIKAGQKSCLR